MVKPIVMGEASSNKSASSTARQTVAESSRFAHSPGVFTQQLKQPVQPLRSSARKVDLRHRVPQRHQPLREPFQISLERRGRVGSPFRMLMRMTGTPFVRQRKFYSVEMLA